MKLPRPVGDYPVTAQRQSSSVKARYGTAPIRPIFFEDRLLPGGCRSDRERGKAGRSAWLSPFARTAVA